MKRYKFVYILIVVVIVLSVLGLERVMRLKGVELIKIKSKSDVEILEEILKKHNLSIEEFLCIRGDKIPEFTEEEPVKWYLMQENGKIIALRISDEKNRQDRFVKTNGIKGVVFKAQN